MKIRIHFLFIFGSLLFGLLQRGDALVPKTCNDEFARGVRAGANTLLAFNVSGEEIYNAFASGTQIEFDLERQYGLPEHIRQSLPAVFVMALHDDEYYQGVLRCLDAKGYKTDNLVAWVKKYRDYTTSAEIKQRLEELKHLQAPKIADVAFDGRHLTAEEAAAVAAGAEGGKTPSLNEFSIDLTSMAAQGKLDPIEGRKNEIKALVQILLRRSKPNAVLIGEPGVGKTAIVEGLAQKIAAGEIPELAGKRVMQLNIGALIAGTKYRGEFEERVQNIMKELKASPDTIVFIDEFHTIMGAGAAEGAVDISNLLKPAMARGEIQIIGATTLDEFRRFVEKDGALARRVEGVRVDAPTPEDTLAILKRLKPNYEKHHKVSYSDAALEAAARTAPRYLPQRQLPDSAIDLMDKAGSLARTAKKTVVEEEDILAILAQMTGIPVDKLSVDEQERLVRMEEHLRKRVKGQEHVIKAVSEAVRRAYAGLRVSQGPLASFVFLGPTGVGKTELAKALAEFLFGTEKALIREDLTNYMEQHSVSKLIGSPPGYVGYEDAPFTERVRQKPFSVILLDELDKAHPAVLNILLPVLDDGHLTDSHGKTVDFKNTIIIMTSNHMSQAFFAKKTKSVGFQKAEPPAPPKAASKEAIVAGFKSFLKPEQFNRIDEVVVFNTLTPEILESILDQMISSFVAELEKTKKVRLEVSPQARAFLIQQGYDPELGARPMRRAIQTQLLTPLSMEILKPKHGSHLVAKLSEDGGRIVVVSTDGGRQ